MTPRNVSSKGFCQYIGIAYHRSILESLRDLGLIENFFKVGRKFMYPIEEAEKINQLLRKNIISLKADNGYYITINKNAGAVS